MITDNPNLQHINLKNGHADFCYDTPGLPSGPPELCPLHQFIVNNPALVSVCVDDVEQVTQNGIIVTEAEFFANMVNNPNVTVSTECLLNTTKVDVSLGLLVYPNPVQERVSIEMGKPVKIESIVFYNLMGQKIKTLTSYDSSISPTIDIGFLKTGTYFMEINTNRGKTMRKLVRS